MSPSTTSPPLPTRFWLLLALLIALGVAIRFLWLDHKFYWEDEVSTSLRLAGYNPTLLAAQFDPPQLITAQALLAYQFPRPDGPLGPVFDHRAVGQVLENLRTEGTIHTPLYFLLTYLWTSLWGNAIAVIRSFSAVLSVLTLPSVYGLGMALFRCRLTAVLAVALVASSPFHVLYAQEARPYSLYLLLTVLSGWALVTALRTNQLWTWVAYGLTVMAGLYSFALFALVVLAHTVYGCLLHWGWHAKFRRFLWATLAGSLALVPWLVAVWPYSQTITRNTRWQTVSIGLDVRDRLHLLSLNFTRPFIDFDWNYGFSLDQWLPYGLVVVATLALLIYATGFTLRHAPREAGLYVLLLIACPGLLLAVLDWGIDGAMAQITRYFAPAYIGCQLAVAYWLGAQLKRWSKAGPLGPSPRLLWQLVAVGLVGIGLLSCGNQALAAVWWNKNNGYIYNAAQLINAADKPLVLGGEVRLTLALAHHLEPDTAMVAFIGGDALPELPPGYSNYFLHQPPTDWVQRYAAATGYQLEPLGDVPIWRIQP
jgi:uncharacterized membrane protein